MNGDAEDWEEGEELGDPTELYTGLMKEVVPQKVTELEGVLRDRSVRFCIDESEERIYFSAAPSSGLITVGLHGSTRLMAHAFSYTSAHLAQHLRIVNRNDGTSLPGNYQEMLDFASHLLTWAVTADVRGSLHGYQKSLTPQFWPDDIAGLVEKCLPEEYMPLAARLFAKSFVWVLFHELSHIQMQHIHTNGLESIEQEREADRLAAEWMLNDCGELTPQESSERQIGIAIALMWLTAPTVYIGPGPMKTHPAPHDRLYQVLEHILDENCQDVWFFVASMLFLHVRNNGRMSVDEGRFTEDWKANANYLLDIISRRSKG